jgi:hypothetical protein
MGVDWMFVYERVGGMTSWLATLASFLKTLPKFPNVSLLNPILAQFSLSRTISPNSA